MEHWGADSTSCYCSYAAPGCRSGSVSGKKLPGSSINDRYNCPYKVTGSSIVFSGRSIAQNSLTLAQHELIRVLIEFMSDFENIRLPMSTVHVAQALMHSASIFAL